MFCIIKFVKVFNSHYYDRGGLVVGRPTAVREDPGSNLIAAGRVYHDSHCDIQPWARVSGCAPLLSVPTSTQPSTLRGTVKWVSAYELSNNNKWRWCLRMIAADRRTRSPNRLVWSEGWRPPGAQSAFIKWTGWTLAMTMLWWQHHKHCPGYYYYYYYYYDITTIYDEKGRYKNCG